MIFAQKLIKFSPTDDGIPDFYCLKSSEVRFFCRPIRFFQLIFFGWFSSYFFYRLIIFQFVRKNNPPKNASTETDV